MLKASWIDAFAKTGKRRQVNTRVESSPNGQETGGSLAVLNQRLALPAREFIAGNRSITHSDRIGEQLSIGWPVARLQPLQMTNGSLELSIDGVLVPLQM